MILIFCFSNHFEALFWLAGGYDEHVIQVKGPQNAGVPQNAGFASNFHNFSQE